MKLLMITCKDMSQLAAKETKPSIREKLLTKAHLIICDHCARYVKQLKVLKTKLKARFNQTEIKEEDVEQIELAAIERIKNNLPRR